MGLVSGVAIERLDVHPSSAALRSRYSSICESWGDPIELWYGTTECQRAVEMIGADALISSLTLYRRRFN
jgi:hypothetical protein